MRKKTDKVRILVADDELDSRVMLRYFLESWGYEVDLATNGQEALEKLASGSPELVLMDFEMPVVDGFAACDRIKSNPATEQIPVILFTGLDQAADRVKGFHRRADDYVVKTVDPEELRARIDTILRRPRHHESPRPTAGGEKAHTAGSGYTSAVSGSLADLFFPEAVQLIIAYGKSGVLRLEDGSRDGRVYVANGQIVHAECDEKRGEEAFYDLALWKSGHFSFQVRVEPPSKTISKSATALLIEAARRVDEWNLISGKIPSFDVVPARVPLTEARSIRLTRADWRVAAEADGTRSIRELAEKLRMDLFEAGRVTYGLLTVGAISTEPDAEKRDGSYDNVPDMQRDVAASNSIELSASQWKVLAYVDGERSIAEVANLAALPASEAADTLSQLAERGLVRLRPRPTAASAEEEAPGGTEKDAFKTDEVA